MMPDKWIDSIFRRLSVRYGRDFLGKWDGIPIEDVKSDWRYVLSGFERSPDAIKYALDNLPVRAPTVLEFKAIANRCPPAVYVALPSPAVDKEKVAAILKQCRDAFKK